MHSDEEHLGCPETYRLRTLFLVLLVVAVPLGLWRLALRPMQIHRGLYDRLDASLDKLRQDVDPKFSAAAWNHAIDWTHNAKANCCPVTAFIEDHPRFRKMVTTFENAVNENEADFDTINWLWDEIDHVSTVDYSHYRSEMTRFRIPPDE